MGARRRNGLTNEHERPVIVSGLNGHCCNKTLGDPRVDPRVDSIVSL